MDIPSGRKGSSHDLRGSSLETISVPKKRWILADQKRVTDPL